MRFLLALKCFFLVLFFNRLPPSAAALLPPAPEPEALPPTEAELVPPGLATTQPVDAALATTQRAPALPTSGSVPARARPADDGLQGAVVLLSILQREGRLLDFLQEEIDGYGDAQIGAAVRDIHRGCKKALDEHFTLEPVMGGAENERVSIAQGFDAQRIRLVGEVKGQPPFAGTLRHHGWAATRIKLPTVTGTVDHSVVAPAEVEIAS